MSQMELSEDSPKEVKHFYFSNKAFEFPDDLMHGQKKIPPSLNYTFGKVVTVPGKKSENLRIFLARPYPDRGNPESFPYEFIKEFQQTTLTPSDVPEGHVIITFNKSPPPRDAESPSNKGKGKKNESSPSSSSKSKDTVRDEPDPLLPGKPQIQIQDSKGIHAGVGDQTNHFKDLRKFQEGLSQSHFSSFSPVTDHSQQPPFLKPEHSESPLSPRKTGIPSTSAKDEAIAANLGIQESRESLDTSSTNNVQNWSNQEVYKCLQEDSPFLASLAHEKGWTGKTLLGLNWRRKNDQEEYKSVLQDMGITDPNHRMTLDGILIGCCDLR